MGGGEFKSLLICSLVSSLFETKEEEPSNICREVNSSSCYFLIWLWHVFVVAPGILSCIMWYLFLVSTGVIFSYTMRTLSCSTWSLNCSVWDLVPWPGIEPGPPALGAWSLSPWTTREVLRSQFFINPWTPRSSWDWCAEVTFTPEIPTIFCLNFKEFTFPIWRNQRQIKRSLGRCW